MTTPVTHPIEAAEDTTTHRARDDARADARRMLAMLDDWVERGWLRALDAAFARFLSREVREAPPLLILAAALASHQLGRGHACLDLRATLDDPAFALSLPPDGPPEWLADAPACAPADLLGGVTLAGWLAALDERILVSPGAGNTPLVLVGTRLYLRRYWQYEQDVRAGIERRLHASREQAVLLNTDAVRAALDMLFPARKATTPGANWQKLACALAARSAFSIVTGGPGTGKTTTVVRLLALLQAIALTNDAAGANTARRARPLRIKLAAPTGKAAARLNESIAGTVARLPLDGFADGVAVRESIPTAVSTLHRVLGTRPDSRRFRHDAANPLPVDVLVIDEASMVDLEMMAAVLDALPESARLILLGDKDQLASVEAGAVLGELCGRAAKGHYTSETIDWLQAATGERIDDSMRDDHGTTLDQAIAMLRESHRFSSDSGIGELALCINEGDAAGVMRVLSERRADVALLSCSATEDASFRSLVVDGRGAADPASCDAAGAAVAARQGYRHYLETMARCKPEADATPEAFAAWAAQVLKAHGAFQLLCAVRRGPWGVEGLNKRIARLLHEEGLIDARSEWYPGRPVLVTRNDYELGLMNGDIGIALPVPGGKDGVRALRVAFPSADGLGGIKWVLPSRLQAVETVFALTVHKSQGSEFEHAALVLPDTYSPILTRELVYTGVTRARAFLTLAMPEGKTVLEQAVTAKVQRASGLLAGFGERGRSQDESSEALGWPK
ncbi:DNA helicase/exodeoxyribonuclease V alpha subunit [Trinickia symbiotica]|uniref:RecBCD enzyme subunit RecD n=1 Tax=Trinickia symbiotica TaxID=863227 RepID=A0A2N7WS74_9BURK|nr:exodeoxyribonuclease V subunit alpha [Trinickia symbiotica]PMS32191.1 exodeoxyribonuclease V subunit alpha [Trinickia symbiotica]PPK41944.1 DNA helicase/exodeoxyribonuclease V alpha subunit [Trinickia symbiotica]